MNSVSVLEKYGLYLLVLGAVVSLVYVFVRQIQTVTRERQERKNTSDRPTGLANDIGYFIDPITLRQLQLSVGILTCALTVSILLVCQIYNPLILVFVGSILFSAGFFAPHFYYAKKVKNRAALFEEGILDFALGLGNGLKAGQALPHSIEVFVKRCENPVMKEELMLVLREYRFGVEFGDAMQHMYERIPCEDLQLLVVSIKLTTQSGGSLSEVLQKMTQMIRGRREFMRKLSALTAQGRFEALAMSLAPLAAFLLLFVVNNDLMLPMVTTAVGWSAIGIMLVLEFVGYLAIRAIIDIKV